MPIDGARPDWSFSLLPPGDAATFVPNTWFHRWFLPDGDVWLLVARTGSDYLLRFPEMADFRLAANRHIHCHPTHATPHETLTHLLLDQVFPLLLSNSGRLLLHASAVAGPTGTFAFTGPSGTGKSTLAASFAKDGYDLLTDDCLAIDFEGGKVLGTPVYPSLRLYPETARALFPEWRGSAQVAHYSQKRRMGLDDADLRFSARQSPLARVYVLESDACAEVRIRPMSPREAFLALVKLTFLLDVDDPAALKKEFEKIERTVSGPLFRRLSFPRAFDLLPAVKNEILRDLRV